VRRPGTPDSAVASRRSCALSRTPGSNRSAAPCLGQHTNAILRDLAKLSKAAIAALDAADATSAEPK
jgi:crotonobetainyl-CoA:carnitine CoA-transferase CaiB-like acyl-CoA transferase